MRLGLCCLFVEEAIRFRTTTAAAQAKLSNKHRTEKLRELAAHNAASLYAAIDYCAAHGIGCFRVNSQILPLKTHPKLGYDSRLLGEEVSRAFQRCGQLAQSTGTRISFHPDQFVVLSSPESRVVKSSLTELDYHAEVAEWIEADVINVHGGGGYGDKSSSLKRLKTTVGELSDRARSRLTLENDDRTYTPRDLLPVCDDLGLPLVYDVHHHRCHGDDLDVETATREALETWNREPLFHVSSPRGGWRADNPRSHSDYIELRDFPTCWDELDITVEVEAKELAVRKLQAALKRRAKRKAAVQIHLSKGERSTTMNLKKYFEEHTGFGVLSTADSDGHVNAAVYARPSCFEDGTVGFIMPDRLTYSNLQANGHASYLFRQDPEEDSGRYDGVRLYLKKVGEDDDEERIAKLRRRAYGDDRDERHLVIFSVEKELPLVGAS